VVVVVVVGVRVVTVVVVVGVRVVDWMAMILMMLLLMRLIF
jgi:hypothetical protein